MMIMRKWVLVLAVLSVPLTALADVTDIAVDGLTLIEEKRTSRFSRMNYYLYTITVTNNGPALENVTARVTSTERFTRITERSLTFGDIAEGETVVSSDTFALGLRRGQVLDEGVLVFTFSGTEVVATDITPPTLTVDVSPAANINGWHNTDVTVSFTCTDEDSGIATCADPIALSTEGEGQQVTGEGLDNAGNSASVSVTINIDKTAPTISFALAPESNTSPLTDNTTLLQDVSLLGTTEPDRQVELFYGNELLGSLGSTVSTLDGSGNFSGVLLAAGDNLLAMRVTDQAGNTAMVEQTIRRTQCHADLFTHAFLVDDAMVPAMGAEAILYDPSSSVFVGRYDQLGIGSDGNIEVLAVALNADIAMDWVMPMVTENAVQIFINDGGSVLAMPLSVDSGASGPVSLAVENFVGDSLPDIAVGHKDGSVTFLEGVGDGNFILHAGSTVSGLGVIQKLVAADFDNDGDADLLVSHGDGVSLLLNDNNVTDTGAVVNGDFSNGLNGWRVSVVGHGPSSLPGIVFGQSGSVKLIENESFRTTLQQRFTLPSVPTQLVFDLTALGLDLPTGGVPDAFEVSLLNISNGSVVPTVDSLATSFFNINPGGVVNMASGVSFDGTRVTLDVSSVASGSDVTLYFDLIGNPPGSDSFVSIDNVDAGTIIAPVGGFSVLSLPGPFIATRGVDYCALSGGATLKLIIDDPGQNQIFIYDGDGLGGFVRTESLLQGGL